jgi:hypothetical protein
MPVGHVDLSFNDVHCVREKCGDWD